MTGTEMFIAPRPSGSQGLMIEADFNLAHLCKMHICVKMYVGGLGATAFNEFLVSVWGTQNVLVATLQHVRI